MIRPIARAAAVAAAAVALALFAGAAKAENGDAGAAAYFSPTDGARLSFEQALSQAAGADVVFLGEVHDNESHHRVQAGWTRALEARRGVSGLAFEMIEPEREAEIAALRADASQATAAIGVLLDWEAAGWPDFAMYAPIFDAAPQALIAGGAVPRAKLRPFMTGADAAFAALAADADAQALGFDAPLAAADQAAREDLKIEGHCNAIPRAAAAAMVSAQRLRDARLAASALRAHRAAPSGVVVVISGSQHARLDVAAPAALAAASPPPRVFALGLIEGDPAAGLSAEALQSYAAWFDVVGVTPPPAAPRGDPCAVFRNQ